MTVKEALVFLERKLLAITLERAEAVREARLVLAFLLDCSPAELVFHWEDKLDSEVLGKLDRVLEKRGERYPLQYILGETEFMSLRFEVNPAVLIPRNDTECLVEAAIELMKPCCEPLIADICCGSGCIAVSLAHYLPRARLIATDISLCALSVAQKNGDYYGLNKRIAFYQGDLLKPLLAKGLKCDLIISNPPYIPTSELPQLAPEIFFEPQLALDGGADGLTFYRNLIDDAPSALALGGYLLLEIGADQKEAVTKLLSDKGLKLIKALKDFGGNYRGLLAKYDT